MNASAYVIGPSDGPGAALIDIAKDLGFETVRLFSGIAQAEQQVLQTPLCFFLCAAVDDVRALAPAARAIRTSSSRNIRFAPLVYFSESPSTEAIKQCIGMGFDDVITMPFTRQRLEERLGQQIDRKLVYCETRDYFGPDRRNHLRASDPAAGVRLGRSFSRIEIMRNPARGIIVLREDAHVPA